MAFLIANLSPVGGQSSRGKAPQIYSYETADTSATVNTAGYFNDVSDKLEVDDIILANCSTGGTTELLAFRVLSNASGVVDVNDGFNMSSSGGNDIVLNTIIDDVSTAGQVFVASPVAGTIKSITSVLNGAIGTADAVLTSKIGGTAVTGGAITITQSGSATGDVDSATPSALNTVTAGQAIEIETNGASTNTIRVFLTIVITPSQVDSD